MPDRILIFGDGTHGSIDATSGVNINDYIANGESVSGFVLLDGDFPDNDNAIKLNNVGTNLYYANVLAQQILLGNLTYVNTSNGFVLLVYVG